jgi:hypothetical protein
MHPIMSAKCSTLIVQCNTWTNNHLCSGSLSDCAVGILSSSFSGWGVGIIIGLVWAVNGDLDSDLTTFNLLAIHLVDGLLLLFLGSKSNESESTTFARFVASLKLLDHETWDWSKGDLGGGWLISSEEFLELF